MKAAVEAISSKEMGIYKASRVFTIFLPPHSSHKIQPLDKAFMRPPKIFYCQETENDSFQNQGNSSLSTELANCLENTSKLQQARQRVMAAW
jgi:hypothetical protein